jgi:hypothetical protein
LLLPEELQLFWWRPTKPVPPGPGHAIGKLRDNLRPFFGVVTSADIEVVKRAKQESITIYERKQVK